MSGYQRKDRFYMRAKATGYRARSAFKLAELDVRFGFLRPGSRVIDLGAWPGAWLQVVSERIGPSGRAVGLDLIPIDALGAPNVATIVGDIRDPQTTDAIIRTLGAPADTVLCDIAPKLTGVRATDEARRAELTSTVITALPRILCPGGLLLIKLFMDEAYKPTIDSLQAAFRRVRTTRPEATRKGSAELYALADGFIAR